MRLIFWILVVYLWRKHSAKIRAMTMAQRRERRWLICFRLIGLIYLAAVIWIDTEYYRGSIEWFLWAALWLPIRWNKQPSAELINGLHT